MKYQRNINKLLSTNDDDNYELAKILLCKIDSPDALERFSKSLTGKTKNILRAKKFIRSKVKRLKGPK